MDATLTSAKPYLVRAIYEWILDNGLTPHLLVNAGFPGTLVPAEFVEDGQIVLNIAPGAVRNLSMANDAISFGARFGGVAREIWVPEGAVLGIFTRENRQGMLFPAEEQPEPAGDASGEETAEQAPPRAPSVSERPGDGAGPKGPNKPRPKGKGGPTLKVVK